MPKLDGNRSRDEVNEERLRRDGWKVLNLWECQIKDMVALKARIAEFLGHAQGVSCGQ